MFKLMVISLAVIGLALWFYEPLDADFEQPWKIRAILRALDIFSYAGRICEFLGVDTYVNTVRNCWDFMGKLGMKDDPTLLISEKKIEGVLVRIYVPNVESKDSFPAVVYFHGGGWVLGSRNTVDVTARHLAKSLQAVIFNVEYRMAPEVTFPQPLHDSMAVTKHLLQNANQYNVDPNRIAVAGDSAGGNLASAVSLRLRDEKFTPTVKLQVLIYPAVQVLDFQTPSCQQNANGPLLLRRHLGYYWSMHLTGNTSLEQVLLSNRHLPLNMKDIPQLKYLDNSKLPKDFLEKPYVEIAQSSNYDKKVYENIKHLLLNPYLAPLMADDLSNLPEAYVITCHLDVLRDEGYWYADRLREAGNKVTYKHYRNAFHGMIGAADGPLKLSEAEVMVEDMTEFMKRNL